MKLKASNDVRRPLCVFTGRGGRVFMLVHMNLPFETIGPLTLLTLRQ